MSHSLIALAIIVPHISGQAVLNDGAGLLNGDFRHWVEGTPLHWEVTGGREHMVSPIEDTDAPGVAAGPGYTWVQITQRVDVDGPPGGTLIEFSCDVLAREADTAKLIVRFAGGRKVRSEKHSGDGRWERLSVQARFPEDYPADYVFVSIHHYNTPDHPALLRNAAVRVVGE